MLFSCYKVARIIAFVQCLQADIAPFIIHAENKPGTTGAAFQGRAAAVLQRDRTNGG